ncbi:MAG: hypothetical protein ACI87W_001604 [Halieaceae bacterium]|jgi:hypothetical protein
MPYIRMGGASQFKEDTRKTVAGKGIFRIRVSGSNLQPIVEALDHYETTINKTTIERQGALCSIISRCKKWKDVKATKIAGTDDPEATVIKRGQRVDTLMAEAWQALQQTDNGMMRGAFEAYSARKAAGAHVTHGLAEGYTAERDAYLASGKTKSLSGSLIDDLLGGGITRVQRESMPAKHIDKEGGGYVKGADGKPLVAPAYKQVHDDGRKRKAAISKATKNRDLNSLTAADYKKIDKITASIPSGMQTKYMKRPERLRCLLEEDGAGGLRYAWGARSAQTTSTTVYPYAMDEWGNIYTASEQAAKWKAQGYAMFNHSSFTAGDEVVCAGMIGIGANGKLTQTDTNSGHYKPTAAQLRAVIVILRDEYLVDFAGAEVFLQSTAQVWPAGQVNRFLAGADPQV